MRAPSAIAFASFFAFASSALPAMASESAPEARLIEGSVSKEDYPSDASANSEEGRTAVSFVVRSTGRAENCMIDLSSGSRSLDARTCELIVQRFRFEPARDPSGKPMDQRQTQAIKWALPAQPTPFGVLKPTRVDLELVVAPDGTVKSCRVLEFVSPFNESSEVACPWTSQGRKLRASDGTKDRLIRYRNLLEITEID